MWNITVCCRKQTYIQWNLLLFQFQETENKRTNNKWGRRVTTELEKFPVYSLLITHNVQCFFYEKWISYTIVFFFQTWHFFYLTYRNLLFLRLEISLNMFTVNRLSLVYDKNQNLDNRIGTTLQRQTTFCMDATPALKLKSYIICSCLTKIFF